MKCTLKCKCRINCSYMLDGRKRARLGRTRNHLKLYTKPGQKALWEGASQLGSQSVQSVSQSVSLCIRQAAKHKSRQCRGQCVRFKLLLSLATPLLPLTPSHPLSLSPLVRAAFNSQFAVRSSQFSGLTTQVGEFCVSRFRQRRQLCNICCELRCPARLPKRV